MNAFHRYNFWVTSVCVLVVISLSTAGYSASMLQTLTGEWSEGKLSGTVTDSNSGGVVLESGNTTGTVTSIPVAVYGRTFLSAECVTYEPEETAISVVLEGDSYGWSTVANVNTPGAFQEAINKRMDMTRLNISGYNLIRLKATLTRNRLDRNPVLIEWRILYNYAGEPQPTVYNFESVKGFSATEQIVTTYSHSETHSIYVQGGTTLRSNRFPVQTGKHVGVDMWLYSPSDQLPQNLYVAVKGYASQTATELKAGVAYILTGGKLTANPYWTSVEPQSYVYEGQSSQAYLTARIIQNPLQTGRWYHFTGRSVKTDTNDWCGWGQSYAPEAWDNSGITHVEVEISANTGNVYLDDVSIVNDVPAPDRSQSEMEYNSINLRPVWQEKYAEIETRLADLRAESASDPRYAVEVTETPDTVTLKRDVWQVTFSRATASGTSAIMRGRPIQGFCLPDLILVDSAGSTYRQRYAANGALSVSQNSNDIVLTGKFTPKTSAGTPAPVTFGVTYKMSRLSGSVLCEMKILSGTVNAKYLSISHSLGIQKPPSQYGFVENMWNQGMGSGYPPPSYPYDNTSWEDTDSTTPRIVMAGPFPVASWSNQIYGVQVYPMTWNGAVVADIYKGPHQDSYLVNMIDSSGAKDTRVTMVHTDTPATLSQGYKIASTFMVMPFREYTPTNQSVVLGSVNFLTVQNGSVADPGQQAAFEEEVRKYAAEGVNTVITWYGTWINDFWPGVVDKATREITVATFHKYGIKVLMYFESSYVTGIHDSMITGRHSLDEINRMYNKWYPHFLRPPDGYRPFSGQVWPCYNYKPSRLQLLVMLNDTLADSDIDGFYLDSDLINMCENPEHELPNATNNHFPGRLALHEELRLLLDDYGRRNNKKYLIVCHSLFQVPGPMVALGDFQLPGEGIGGRVVKSLQTLASDRIETGGEKGGQILSISSPGTPDGRAIYYTTYNSLMGNQVILYDDCSYDLTLPQIYHEAYSRCLSPWLNVWPYVTWTSSGARKYTDAELDMYRKYMMPFVIFDTSNTTLHHWEDVDIHKYVSTSPSVQASVYTRQGESLVTIADDTGANWGTVSVTMLTGAMGLGTGDLLVYDIPNDSLMRFPVASGKASGTVSMSSGPAMLLVRPMPTTPTVIWKDHVVKQIVSESYSADTKTLAVSLKGIHKAPAVVRIYTPRIGMPQVTGGTYNGSDATGHLHTIALTFSTDGTATLNLTWP